MEKIKIENAIIIPLSANEYILYSGGHFLDKSCSWAHQIDEYTMVKRTKEEMEKVRQCLIDEGKDARKS